VGCQHYKGLQTAGLPVIAKPENLRLKSLSHQMLSF
jgi:hypothetical protein